MSDQTKGGIAWTDETWNPTRGCSRVSEGCRHCYAERQAARMGGRGQAYEGLVRIAGGKDDGHRIHGGEPRWTGVVRMVPEKLAEPLRWRKPRRVFVNSMSDLFHERLTNEEIAAVFGVMAAAPQHTFQVLTKRVERMREWFAWAEDEGRKIASGSDWQWPVLVCAREAASRVAHDFGVAGTTPWPLANVWLGVSVEDQATADERIPLLLKTPAAVRFVSYEPALGPIVFWRLKQDATLGPKGRTLDWIIVGGESGPGARPMDVAWARSTIEQCKASGVACFVKQLGAVPGFKLEDEEGRGNDMPSFHHAVGDLYIKRLRDPKGGDPDEWPADLRVREFPR